MKYRFFYFFFLLTVNAIAQQSNTIILEWKSTSVIQFQSYQIVTPSFQPSYFNLDEGKKEIFFQNLFTSESSFSNPTIQISNVQFESVSREILGDLDLKSLPNQINSTVIPSISRGVSSVFLRFSPIIKDAEGFKRVTSFTYAINESSTSPNNKFKRSNNIASSVLASGDWFRFYIEKSGVYQISKSFLSDLGFNTTIDPRTIKIYGNGGQMIPLMNNANYPFDITENAIQFIGEEDGTFNDSDYILFYAEGIDNWSEENGTHNNLYADKSYYYITSGGANGKRMANMIQPSSPSITITKFDDYQYHELDLINVVKTGRRWLGESFSIDNEQEFSFQFPNSVKDGTLELTLAAGAAAFTTTNFAVSVNNLSVGSVTLNTLYSNSGTELVLNSMNSKDVIPSADEVKVKLTYNNNGVPTSKGYLDYLILKCQRNLIGYGKQFRFQYNAAADMLESGLFQFSNATSISQVWDITDIFNVTKTINSNSNSFSFTAPLGEIRKYIALDINDIYSPLKDASSRVFNQDLKGTLFKNSQGQFEDIDYVIITPSFLATQASKLADFHKSHSNLNVKVIPLELIYHEFGSGKQDIAAIRNCIKYVYDNASSDSKRLKYVNLFGDASFDFKDRIPNNTNIVPIYHSLNSTTIGESSFASDDFFGLMDPNEGNITYFFGGIDIAVGRMIADNPQQADELVNKVIDYYDKQSFGNWRNNCVFIADDSDKPSDASLQSNQNDLADEVSKNLPFINVKKILLDAYVQETSSGGNRYPKVRDELFRAFEKGALVFNYLGHGGEDGLTGERIWEKADGQNLNNPFKYPLFITITCDFSRFDNPYRPTAGEYTFWNPKGGAVSMITTIRTINQSSAEVFNERLSKFLFSYGGTPTDVTIAESLRNAKNENPNSSTNVVFYIGDPALKLAVPKPSIRLTKVNDISVGAGIPDFQSLAPMKITGEVVDASNQILTNYNGAVSINIFDKDVTKVTLNNDGNSPPINFNTSGETIFRGNATVVNGVFEINFIVPRDIKIPVGNGRLSFYAQQENGVLDKTGVDTSIKIGGINSSAVADTTPPKLKLYLNDTNFISGGITNTSPILIAYLEDENGMNTSSGIGHDMVVVLDGNESNPFVVNEYYETEVNNYKKGSLRYALRNLSLGLHTLTFKAWDVYNNLVTSDLQFNVVSNESITLTNVLNYPNPFVNYTQFWFTHNRPFEPLEVQVQVMTVTGKIVWTKNQLVTNDGFLSRDITWDGKDDFGDRIGKGVYVYKLTVKSLVSNTKTEKFEKLVIL